MRSYTEYHPGSLHMSELVARGLLQPRCVWELEQEAQVQLGAGALNVDQDRVQELTKTFRSLH